MGLVKDNNSEKFDDIVAAIPALMLCAVSVLVLALDIAVPAMKEKQYLIYPVLIRIAEAAGIICAAVCCITDINEDRIGLKAGGKALPFVLFSVCIMASTIVNGVSHDAIFGVAYRYVGVFDLLVYMAVYLYCTQRIKSGYLKRLIMYVIIAFSDLTAMAFIYHMFICSIPAFEGKVEPAGMFFHGNHYGYFLVMAVIISAAFAIYDQGISRYAGIISALLNLTALMVNRTMGALLAVCTAAFLMAATAVIKGDENARRTSAVLLTCSLLLVAVSFGLSSGLRNDASQIISEISGILGGTNNIYAGNGRWGIWQFVAELIAVRPLLGYGCEGIKDVMLDYALTASPHNEPLTYAAFFGIPAALFYCFAVIRLIVKSVPKINNDAVSAAATFASLGYFLSSFLGLAVFYTTPFFFILLGVAASGNRSRHPEIIV